MVLVSTEKSRRIGRLKLQVIIMNIDTRYEEPETVVKTFRILQFIAFCLCLFLLFNLSGCATKDTSVSNAANQCYPSGLQSYSYHGGTGSLQVVCK